MESSTDGLIHVFDTYVKAVLGIGGLSARGSKFQVRAMASALALHDSVSVPWWQEQLVASDNRCSDSRLSRENCPNRPQEHFSQW